MNSEKRSRMYRVGLVFAFLAVFAGAASRRGFAQSTTEGAIGGTVTDQTKAVVPGATVTAKNTATNTTTSTVTDANGHFTVIRLNPGTYTVDVSLSGFTPFNQGGVIVEVGRVTNMDVTISVGGQVESVSVVAQAPVINRESSDLSTNINQTSIANLPVSARRWSNYVLSTPGAAPDGTFGLISFRGISGLLNNNTVDGGDNTQAFFAEERGRTRLSYSLSLGAVQEFQVTTSNYSAEYGRAAGGVVNAVTKSGGNKIQGEGLLLHPRQQVGRAEPVHDDDHASRRCLPDGAVQARGSAEPVRRQHRRPHQAEQAVLLLQLRPAEARFPGRCRTEQRERVLRAAERRGAGHAGGAGALRPAAGNDGLAFMQSLTGVVARTGDQTLLFPKIDWQINNDHALAVSYNHLRWNSPAGVQTAATVFRGVDNWGDDGVSADWVIGRFTSVLGPRLTNEVRFQWGRDFEFQTSQPAIPGEPVVPGTTRSPDVNITGTVAFEFGKPNFMERRSYPDERRVQIADTATLLWNTHLIKFGIDFNRTHDTLDNLFQEGGVYTYTSRADFISDYELNTKLGRVGRFYSTFAQGIGPDRVQFRDVRLRGRSSRTPGT